MAKVVLEKVSKAFFKTGSTKGLPWVEIIHSLNLTVEEGEFLVLVGPSGCGKSTLLRLIAGLEMPTAGNIWMGDRLINSIAPKDRNVAMVFQNYALYPHLSVYDNIAFGLRRLNPSTEDIWVSLSHLLPKAWHRTNDKEKEIDIRVRSIASMLQIESLLTRLPEQLSGGQKQRVALGRAISREPQVFLMDEPLSNLDAQLRGETRSQIVNLQRQLGVTTLYVTHDQVEAMTMGTRIAVLEGGKLQQIDKPLNIYNRPANRFVAEFIGSPMMNFITVEIHAPLLITHPQFRFTLSEQWAPYLHLYNKRKVTLGIRPEHLVISPPATKNIQVKVESLELLGSDTYLFVRLVEEPDLLWQVRTFSSYTISIGELIWLGIPLDKLHLFDRQTGLSLWQ